MRMSLESELCQRPRLPRASASRLVRGFMQPKIKGMQLSVTALRFEDFGFSSQSLETVAGASHAAYAKLCLLTPKAYNIYQANSNP